MRFLSRLFSRGKTTNTSKSGMPEECRRLLELGVFFDDLFLEDIYVARKTYKGKCEEYKEIIQYFEVLESSGQMGAYCKKSGIAPERASDILKKYNTIDNLVELYNEEFIRRHLIMDKDYLDEILKDVDSKIVLDEDQRRVVLTDEDYCLVIAGAGAGKTTTVAAKVKYLVEKKNINPRDILVISFTNKAVGELKEKIQKDLKIDCPIATFHATGNAVLHMNDPENLNIVDGSKLYFVLQYYFKNSILTNETLVNNLIRFFAVYFDAPYEGNELNAFFNKIAKSNFATMRSDLDEFKCQVVDTRTKKKVTIQNEILRSHQEVEIANYLYLNSIEYEYEPIYQYNIEYARKPYTPDFIIRQGEKVAYIEHFGITEDGQNDRYTLEQLAAYKDAINDKVLLHKKHGTQMLYTFSEYNDGRPLTEHLKEKLEDAGFVLVPRSNQEIMKKLISSEETKYIRKLVNLICRFIANFKTNGYTADEFNRMYHSTQNVRSRLFLDICQDCYLEYERYLKKNHAVDFEDMINESARVLREVKEMKQKLNFKYIIVDEYQDISKQRFDLTTALAEVTDAKIIAVGDDWQSIYAFSGSDISLFTKFEERMGYAKLLKIVKTYRNSQEVIDIAGNFIQKNPHQITKTLVSPKKIQDPVIIYTYDSTYKSPNGDRRSGVNYATAYAVETALNHIVEMNRTAGKPEDGTILLLGRYGFDGDMLEKSGLFEYINRGNKIKSVKYPKLDITFMTVHMSKGLGYDNVIVVNGRNETYGFPSKIEDDPVLAFVIKGNRSIDYAEERRLFYVAMTRTKNRVYFIAPEQNPSEFLLEIKKDYKNVVLKGNWNEDESSQKILRKSCPICGYPLQFKYKKAYGLRLYICTNEPEVCGYMSNEYTAGKLSIMKCDKCRDGYLIVKPTKDGQYFLGCTNYKKDKTGCDKIIWSKDYYKLLNLTPDKAEPVKMLSGRDIPPKSNSLNDSPNPEAPQNANSVERFNVASDRKTAKTEPVGKANQDEKVYYKEQDLYITVFKILNGLEQVSASKYFGITVLVGVLCGYENKKISDNALNLCGEYGGLKHLAKADVRAIIEWLIANHYILKTKGNYPVLHQTYKGNHYEEMITVAELKKLKVYLEHPDREVFEEE
ncbi:MAG: UvrD-helicase domain-containing protein [Eubacteriales bacterium]|nr:UvrD-helicase domain-containing protein [Eubacteriales bacterium]